MAAFKNGLETFIKERLRRYSIDDPKPIALKIAEAADFNKHLDKLSSKIIEVEAKQFEKKSLPKPGMTWKSFRFNESNKHNVKKFVHECMSKEKTIKM